MFMKKIFFVFSLILVVSQVRFAKANEDVVGFTKQAYEAMVSINPNSANFSEQSLSYFKTVFNFRTFGARVLYDLQKKMTNEEYMRLMSLFEEVFFKNFANRAQTLAQRKIENPQYAIKEKSSYYTIVSVSGNSSKGKVMVNFYITKQGSQFFIVDLSINGALLSRNYHRSFNKIYTKDGTPGLFAKLEENKK